LIKINNEIKNLNIEDVYVECGLNNDSLFIDLGANTGQQVKYLTEKRVGTIIAFEPHPIIYSELVANCPPSESLQCYQMAAWIRDEKRNLFFKNSPRQINGGSSLIYEKTNIDRSAAFVVECIDFSKFLFDLDKDVSVLKVDIEGSEYHLISHLINSGAINYVKNIFVEDHERKIESGTVFYGDYIQKRKFVLDFFRDSKIDYYSWK